MILAMNYDGLYRHVGDRPTEEDIERVRRFREKGGIFGIVTDRDVFTIMAIIGMFRGEYDFLVCSSGVCVIAKTSDPTAGVALSSVGVESELPVQLYCHTCHQSFLTMLYDLFSSVGMTFMTVDTPGFRGGMAMARDFAAKHAGSSEVGCGVHFWYDGGQYFIGKVGREALDSMRPFTACAAGFKNEVTAIGVCDAVERFFPGKFEVNRSGGMVFVTAKGCNREYAIRRYAEFAGVADGDIMVAGSCEADICALRAFGGIALSGSDPKVMAAAASEEESFARIMDLAMERVQG